MANVLQDLSDSLAETVSAAGAVIVRVEGRRRISASGIIWSEDGLIVTANHVVRHDENIGIGLPGGQTVKAALVGRDASTDLALLRAEASGLKPAARADSAMQVGHLVLALGRPGRTVQATLGIISALGDSWRTAMGGKLDHYLQTDVVMYPGFSGGALVSTAGQFLGMNTSGLMRGVSLTVPLSSIKTIAETLATHGRMRRGYLGVSTQPVRLPANAAREADQESGLLIVTVESGSPAEEGGLLLGDTIVALDGEKVRHYDDLLALLSGDRVGKKVPVQIIRGGETRTLNVALGERP